jgi:hypothetical protein
VWLRLPNCEECIHDDGATWDIAIDQESPGVRNLNKSGEKPGEKPKEIASLSFEPLTIDISIS